MQNGESAPTVLPLGCNCQLGAALTRLGHHESSLLRWADIALEPLLAFLEGARPSLFDGQTRFRFAGTTFGTLDEADMRARLAQAPQGGPINTIVEDSESAAYVHGVQLSRSEAAGRSYDEIRAANAAKVESLTRKWRAALAGASPLAIRLEWTPIVDAAPFARLAAALRRVNPSVQVKIVGPAGGLEGRRGGAEFIALRSPLPPPSDIMNVGATEAEWREWFARWGVRPLGAPRAYVFDL